MAAFCSRAAVSLSIAAVASAQVEQASLRGAAPTAAQHAGNLSSSWSPPPPPPHEGGCGYGPACSACEVCVGTYHVFTCAGACASHQVLCPAPWGDSSEPCTTCKDKVELRMLQEGSSLQDAMRHVGQEWEQCSCLAAEDEQCGYGEGGGCSACEGEVCLGSYYIFTCAGSCASNRVCSDVDGEGSCTTCKGEVELLMQDLGFSLRDAMQQVGTRWEQECSCLAVDGQ